MSVERLRDLLAVALRGGWCLGYFEAWDQCSLETSLEAAEQARAPAIIGFGGAVTDQRWLDRRGVELLATIARRLAESATVPCVVLFNEGKTIAQVERALAAGCNAVMLDTSHLSFGQNVALTRQVVAAARRAEADVEAELGQLADGRNPVGVPGRPTDPEEARRFVAETGVDCLAVSAGGVHVLSDRTATLDLERIAAVRAAASVPLVLHGGTGLPDEVISSAAARGVAKVNYGTRLKQLFLRGLRESVEAVPGNADVHQFVGSRSRSDVTGRGLELVKAEIARLLKVYGCAGRARPRTPERPQ